MKPGEPIYAACGSPPMGTPQTDPKHPMAGLLEQAGMVTTEKVGRMRTCRLGRRGFDEEVAWIEERHRIWSARFDALDHVIEAMKRKENADGRTRE